MATVRELSYSNEGQIATPTIMVEADPDIETGSVFHPTDEFEDGGGVGGRSAFCRISREGA